MCLCAAPYCEDNDKLKYRQMSVKDAPVQLAGKYVLKQDSCLLTISYRVHSELDDFLRSEHTHMTAP